MIDLKYKGLYFIQTPDGEWHISRGNVAGSKVECGIIVDRSFPITQQQPQRLCHQCIFEIRMVTQFSPGFEGGEEDGPPNPRSGL